MKDTRTFLLDMVILFLFLAVLWALAFTYGLMASWGAEFLDASVYGVASRYEGYENPYLQIFLWQGKGEADPDAMAEGLSPTGDVHGNGSAFYRRRLNEGVRWSNMDWEGHLPEKEGSDAYRTPVLTVKHRDDGRVLAVYEHGAAELPDGSTRPSLLYSPDITRVPADEGRPDVFFNYGGFAEFEGTAVLHVTGVSWGEAEVVYFQDRIPWSGKVMEDVFRYEYESGMVVYAMHPEKENSVIATAHLTLRSYGEWFFMENGRPALLTEEQEEELRELNTGNCAGCYVTMDSYREEMVLE